MRKPMANTVGLGLLDEMRSWNGRRGSFLEKGKASKDESDERWEEVDLFFFLVLH
jgi:hypothetical protein